MIFIPSIRINEDIIEQQKYLAADFHRHAYARYEDLDYRDAVALYGKSLELNDQSAAVFHGRAWVLYKLREYDAALEDVKRAIALEPTKYKSYALLDAILVKSRDWVQIIYYWNRYIELVPNNPDAYFERYGTYLHYGDAESSVRDLKKAADLGHVKARQSYEALMAQKSGNNQDMTP